MTNIVQITQEDLMAFATQIAEQTARRLQLAPKFYTLDEVADIFRVSTRTIQNWVSRGELQPKNVGGKLLFSQMELNRFSND